MIPEGSYKRVLITGATGFIGSHLTLAFLKEGWSVLTVLHTHPLHDSLLKAGANPVHLNINEPDSVKSILSEVDVVCHVAAFIPPNSKDSRYAEECLKTNALFTLRFAELSACVDGLRFIYFSSAQAYSPSKMPANEDAPLYPAGRGTYYLSSKLLGELYVEHLRRTKGLQAVTLRLGLCYGVSRTARSVVSIFIESALSGKTLNVYDNISVYDFIYVDDVMNVTIQAAKAGDPGIYNIGIGTSYSILELAKAVADTFPEREVSIQVLPPAGRIPAGFSPLSIEKAIRTWNFNPRNLREGLKAYRKKLETIWQETH